MNVSPHRSSPLQVGVYPKQNTASDNSPEDRWVEDSLVEGLPPKCRLRAATGRQVETSPAPATSLTVDLSSESISRKTLGLSGQACEQAPLTQSHLAFIHRGLAFMDQVAPGFRERFDQLLAPEVDTQLEAQLQATAQQITQLSGRHAQLLITPEHLLDAASRQMKFHLEAQQAELVSLYEKLERKKMDCERKQVSQATDLAASFLRRLRHHQPSNQVSGGLSLDAKALERLRKDGLSEQEVSGWFQQFHHQVGLPTPQKAIKFTYNDDRARFFAKPDLLNIGAKFSRRLMLHELAHRLEYRCPEISIANKQWVAARAAQAQFQAAVPLQELVPKGKYAEDEKAFPDHFVDPYVGKQYADMATEVLSVGLEHLADAKGLVRLYRQDSEHFFLTLGALQAAQSKLAKDLAW